MRLIYSFFLFISTPFVLARLFWRSLKNPDYRKRWRERLGFLPPVNFHHSIWIHAVSVGEAQAAELLIKRLIETYPNYSIVVTTTTPTGGDRVAKLFGDQVQHFYFPYDLPFALMRFIKQVRPRLLIMMETEIWPNLLYVCEKKSVPTLLANARLSERSAQGYAHLGNFTRQVFGGISQVAAQSAADAERFVKLGVRPEQVKVTGSIKFDIKVPGSIQEQAEVLRRQWGDRPVWVAASTHEGEESQVLSVHKQLREVYPGALLVVVPRHPERFDPVFNLIKRNGLSVGRRSEVSSDYQDVAVYLGDTMGELPVFLAAADTAFVGGSFVSVGGHNILEPAALGVPVIFGPHMFNFSSISELFLAKGAAVQVATSDDLTSTLIDWLGDASRRAEVGEAGKLLVEENSGALDRLYRLVQSSL